MSFAESIRIALDSIKVNKMRSILTMLGIIIGISSVITITTIGSSLKATIASSLKSLGGANVINCYVTANFPETDEDYETWVYPDMTENDYIQVEDIEGFISAFEGEIENVNISSYVGEAQFKGKDGKASVEILGNLSNATKDANIEMLAGRDITMRDSVNGKYTAVVSDWFVKYALKGESPIGKKLDFSLADGSLVSVYVVGIYEYDQQKFGTLNEKKPKKDITTPLYVSFPVSKNASLTGTGIENFTVLANDNADPTAFSSEIKDYFNSTVYANNTNFSLECYDMSSELSAVNQILNVITVAISVIAAISLVVGGIGVMNIMLVSVVERTREIGIRKALGARSNAIKKQFLTEAVVICLIGGLLGIIIGLISGYLLTLVGGQILASAQPDIADMISVSFRPSILAIIISVVFSMIIGIIFGSYPANRAAKLDPIEALRYE